MNSQEQPQSKTNQYSEAELMRHIKEGTCPVCGNNPDKQKNIPVILMEQDPLNAGFCSAHCRKEYERQNDPGMGNFEMAKEMVAHEKYLEEEAAEIGMPVKELEVLLNKNYSTKKVEEMWKRKHPKSEDNTEMKKAA